jgi:hypothetical protein
LFLTLCQVAPAGERYYVLVFGSQTMPPDPRHSHSFAAFVKVTECDGKRSVDYHTISWLSQDGQVRIWAPLPEPAKNWELHETINFVLCDGQRVSLWGPYEVDGELYGKSVRQLEKFAHWNTKYKAVDSGYPTFIATNCIHALSAVAGINRVRAASPSWGETASWFVMKRYERYVINADCKHMWLVAALGLDRYPIIYRDLEPPRSGAVWTLVQRVACHRMP